MNGQNRRTSQTKSEVKAALRQKTQGITSDDKSALYGPYLRLWNGDPDYGEWKGSVMIALNTNILEPSPPSLKLVHNKKEYVVQGEQLDECENWQFWRFMITLEILEEESVAIYEVSNDSGFCTRQYPFCIAGANQPWRWGFHSCAGFSRHTNTDKWGGASPLWRDLMKVHKQRHMHALVGGGDQIYNDGIFEVGPFKEWILLKERQTKRSRKFDELMQIEATHYYLLHYMQHFNTAAMRDALACIPQIMVWDDHDIFDGWGSYPEPLQNCPVFQGLYKVAERFYLLFQHHTTKQRLKLDNDLFDGDGSFSWERRFGHNLHLFAVDERAQRTQKEVLPDFTWKLIWQRLENIPSDVKHLVIVSTTTVIYPEIPLAENMMQMLSSMNKVKLLNFLMNRTGIAAKMLEFDEPSLLDDLQDHWTANVHKQERRDFINRLQDFSKRRGIRVSFVAGDVHLCCAAQFYSYPKIADALQDFRLMPQIVSSAIVNAPPPEKLVKMLHLSSASHKGDINSKTKEKIIKLFKHKHKNHQRLLPRRNWLEVCLIDQEHSGCKENIGDNTSSVRNYELDDRNVSKDASTVASGLTQALSNVTSLGDDFDEMLQSVVTQRGAVEEEEEEEEDSDTIPSDDNQHYLVYTLRVEDPNNIGTEPDTFTVQVPPLRLQGGGGDVRGTGLKGFWSRISCIMRHPRKRKNYTSS